MAYKKTMRVSSKKKSTRKIRSTASKRKTNKKNSRTHKSKSKSKSKSKKNKKAFRKTKSATHRNRNHQQGTKKYKGGSDPSRQSPPPNVCTCAESCTRTPSGRCLAP